MSKINFFLFILIGLLSNTPSAFSEDKRKSLSESEAKQILEQLKNSDSLLDSEKGSSWSKYDAFFQSVEEKAKTYHIPSEIIYELAEKATFRVDDQLRLNMRQISQKGKQERDEKIRKYKDQPALFFEEILKSKRGIIAFYTDKLFWSLSSPSSDRDRLKKFLNPLIEKDGTFSDLNSYKLKHNQFFPRYIEYLNENTEEDIKNQMDPNESSYKEHKRGQAVSAFSEIALHQALPPDVITKMSRILIDTNNPNVTISSGRFFIGIVLHAKPIDRISAEIIHQLYYSLRSLKTGWMGKEAYLLSMKAILKLANSQLEDIPPEIISELKDIKASKPTKEEKKLANQILKKIGCRASF